VREIAVRSPATLLVVLLLHFCSPISTLNALAPRDGITVTRDISYADGPRRMLDIYASNLSAADSPRQPATAAPVVVFFYGGGWASGSKEMYRFIGATLAARGILVMIPDYRLYPYRRFRQFPHGPAATLSFSVHRPK
jgi:acetyl esterase/lipase